MGRTEKIKMKNSLDTAQISELKIKMVILNTGARLQWLITVAGNSSRPKPRCK